MRAILAAGLACLCGAGSVAAQEGRWITFKTGHNGWGRIEYQIDAQSVAAEGRYKTFWSRVWIVQKKQPMVITIHEALFALSLKYAVDCAQHRFGSRFTDSNDPADVKRRTALTAMRWESLAKFPAIDRAVCGTRS
jgi:hypothetical protein